MSSNDTKTAYIAVGNMHSNPSLAMASDEAVKVNLLQLNDTCFSYTTVLVMVLPWRFQHSAATICRLDYISCSMLQAVNSIAMASVLSMLSSPV